MSVSPLQLVETRLAVEPYPTPRCSPRSTRHNEISTRLRWYLLIPSSRAHASYNPLLVNVYRQINHVRLNAQWDAMKEKILTPHVIAQYN